MTARLLARLLHGALSLACLLCLFGCERVVDRPEAPSPAASNPDRGPQPDLLKRLEGAPISPFPRIVTDSRGSQITVQKPPERIVSLAPSNTELLFALNLGRQIVGVTTACDYPVGAKAKPKIGGFQTNIESVLAKNPDLVVAVAGINGRAIARLEKAKVPVLTIDPKTIADVVASIRLLGRATGADVQAARVVMEMEARLNAVRRAVESVAKRPKTFIVYELKPTIYTTGSGSFIDEIITIAGGENIVKEPMPQGSVITSEQVMLAQPEVIIAGQSLRDAIRQMPGWADSLPALRDNRIYAPEKYLEILTRPGPRLADAAEGLAAFLHPEVFDLSRQ